MKTKTSIKRVLITGHNGYIGSVMAPHFVQAGYESSAWIQAISRMHASCPMQADNPLVRKDIRDLELDDLEGFDAVVHLAALSNDPIGNLNAGWTEDINFKPRCGWPNWPRRPACDAFCFHLPASCTACRRRAVVTEESPLDPKTEYARSKVKSERAITELAGDGFSPDFLRNGTIYGVSPRMRFDTVLNDLIGAAVTTGKVVVYSDGKPWRPVVHVQDVARAF